MFKLTAREQKLIAILGGLLLLGLVLRITLPEDNQAVVVDRSSSSSSGAPLEYAREEAEGDSRQPAAGASGITVHVTGNVVQPGVYELPEGARVIDALEKAGGNLDEADLVRINLAQPLLDGQQVYIPALPPEGEDVQHPVPQQLASPEKRVNINTADRSELEGLPGIGAVKAQSIINHREQHGQFQAIEDLLEVSGIGEKTLESIKEQVSIY